MTGLAATLAVFCTASFLVPVSPETWPQQAAQEYSRDCPWECLAFVQMWPGSFCVALGKRFECVMLEKANNWTIHGLWPNNVKECCYYWHLFPSDIKDLMLGMETYWPSFINMSNFQFWEKEWQKHGTCAGCVETLSSPNKYFRTALLLRTKYNIDEAFQRAAVVPSCSRNYQLNTLLSVLRPILGDQFELQCVTDGQGRQILVQIKVWLYRNFSTGCITKSLGSVSPYEPCWDQKEIFYFPPNHKNPHNPCP